MIVAGVDVGSRSAKALVLRDDEIVCWSTILTSPDVPGTATKVLGQALDRAGVPMDGLDNVVATGYGRANVPFARSDVTEISCHARGTHRLFPEVRTILDMGGQDCKAIRCDERGRLVDFVMNDKCAAGTGRFLERVARTLELPLEDIGPMSMKVIEEPALINSYCAVFAEGDIVRLLRRGKHPEDILAGACEAITKRIMTLLKRVGIEEGFSISGGVAKNIGIVSRLEQATGLKARIAFDPQIIGALGAAVFAQEKRLSIV